MIQVAAIIAIVFGVIGKIGALFATIPTPIIGGVFYVMFGLISAVGISNLQVVDLNSSRSALGFGNPTLIFSIIGKTIPQRQKSTMGNNENSISNHCFRKSQMSPEQPPTTVWCPRPGSCPLRAGFSKYGAPVTRASVGPPRLLYFSI